MAEEWSKQSPLMSSDEFRKFFAMALKDEDFRRELAVDGFGALARAGFRVEVVPPEIRASLARMAGGPGAQAKPRCGVCGVCGVCSLCGEIDAGSGSAALWALFHLALTLEAE